MKIELKNFQAHALTMLNLRDGLVCVVGSSNAGKSSIVRALRLLIYDGIRGNRFIRHGQQSATVNVQFNDVAVARVKGKKENRYIVGGEKYDAIGVGISVEAAKALNMPLIKVDKDIEVELHVSSQLNPPFLILDNDSTRAKFLNVLTGGHILDASLRETNRKIRELDESKKGIQAQLDCDRERLKAFADIPAKEAIVADMKAKLERLDSLEKTVEKLANIQTSLGLIRGKKSNLETLLAALSRHDWAKIYERLNVLSQTVESVDRLSKIRYESNVIGNKIKALTLQDWHQFLARLDRIVLVTDSADNTKRIRNSLQPINSKLAFVSGIDCVLALNRLSDIQSVMETGEKLRSVRLSFGLLTGQEAKLGVELAVVREKFLQLDDFLCSECGQQVTKATREQHLKETANA